jgi:hypothetical protein
MVVAMGDERFYDRWTCPFCGKLAESQTQARVLCHSRTCACGAIGLAAPAVDQDEIIDDAIGIFRARIHAESHGFDARLLADLTRAGVAIRNGERVALRDGPWGVWTSMWFRRA